MVSTSVPPVPADRRGHQCTGPPSEAVNLSIGSQVLDELAHQVDGEQHDGPEEAEGYRPADESLDERDVVLAFGVGVGHFPEHAG